MKISVVSPVYKGANLVGELVKRIGFAVESITSDYEIVLVEDGSPDNSWEAIQRACKINNKVVGVKLSRNFGQHYAITAGLQTAVGKWVVVMDCDLQDQPEEIPKLYQKAQEGFDIVFAQRFDRQDKFLKRFFSKLFYKVFSYLTDTEQDASIANFGIYHRKVTAAILSMKDHIRYFPTMSQWVGFSVSKLQVKHAERDEGESSYSWSSLINLAVNNIIAFSDKPLRLTIRAGLFISFLSIIFGVVSLIQYFSGDIEVLGYTSLIISIWFLSGLIIFVLGIIGIYLGKIFDRVKGRPIYIIEQRIN